MSIIKHLCYNPDNGRLILSDNKNNHYLCDIYGNKKTKFLPNVTGIVSYQTRKNLIPKNITNNHHNNSEIKQSKFINYLPITKKFEGYSNFPRPLVSPFSNISKLEFPLKNKSLLIKTLEQFYSCKKIQDYLKSCNNNNNSLDYLTCNLNKVDMVKEDGIKLRKLIDETINHYKNKNKIGFNFDEHHLIIALKNFKNILLENKETKIINGKKLNLPHKEIIKNFNIIHKLIHQKKKKNKSTSDVFNQNLTYNSFNNLKDFSPGKKTRKFSEMVKKTEKDEIDIKNIDKEKNVFDVSTKDFFYSTKDSMNNKFDDNTEKNNKIENKDDISFISFKSNNEIKYENENNKRIKGNGYYIKKCNHELKFINGFKQIIPKERPIFQKFSNLKLKTNGELFLDNMNLLKKTNSIAFRIRKEQEDFEYKLLQKKKYENKINYMNQLKTSQKIEKKQLRLLRRINSMY